MLTGTERNSAGVREAAQVGPGDAGEQSRGGRCQSGLLPWEPLSADSLPFQAAPLCRRGKIAALTVLYAGWGSGSVLRAVKSKLLQLSATSGA